MTLSMSLRAHLRSAAAVLFLLGAGALEAPAQAAEPTSPQAICTLSATSNIPIAGAITTARHVRPSTSDSRSDMTLAWDTRFVVEVDASFDFQGGSIAFALPLEEGEVLSAESESQHITAARDASGRVTGICVPPHAIRDRTIAVSFVQPLGTTGAEIVPLGVPVAASSAVQIIETSLAGGSSDARIEPVVDAKAGTLEKHVGYVAPRAISHGAREEARRLTETKAKVTTSPIFLRGDDLRAAGGLHGQVVDARARAKGSALSVGVLFAFAVGGLVFAARRLRHSATEEHADAVLAAEIESAAARSRRARHPDEGAGVL